MDRNKILIGLGVLAIIGTIIIFPKIKKNTKCMGLFPSPNCDRKRPKSFTNCKKWWFQGNACGCADTIGGGKGYGPRIFNSIDECIVQNNVSTENQLSFEKRQIDMGY